MNCEKISQKAIELNIKPEQINIIKEPFNGFKITKTGISINNKQFNKLNQFIMDEKKKKKVTKKEKTIFEKLNEALKTKDVQAVVKCFYFKEGQRVSMEFLLKISNIYRNYKIKGDILITNGKETTIELINGKINPSFLMKI